jgi:hypothetical protein
VMAEGESTAKESEFVVAAAHEAEPEAAVAAPEVAEPEAEEIDLSSEWDDALTVDADAPPAEGVETPVEGEAISSVAPVADDPEKSAETIEEIRFYLEHGMPEQATAAFEKLRTFTSDEATIETLRAEIATGSQPSPGVEEVTAVEDISEFSAEEPAGEIAIEEIPQAAVEVPTAVEESIPGSENTVEEMAVPALEAQAPAPGWPTGPKVEAQPEAPIEATIELEAEAVIEPAPVMEAAVESSPELEPAPGVLQEFVSDLESSLGDSFLTGAVAHEVEPDIESASVDLPRPEVAAHAELEPVGQAAPTGFGVAEPELMGEFVADLEASLGPDFLKDAPLPEAQSQQPVAAVKPVAAVAAAQTTVSTPVPAPVVQAPAASAAAAAAGVPAFKPQAAPQTPQKPTAPPPLPSVAPSKQTSPAVAGVVIPGAPAAKSSPFIEEAGIDLAEMFGDLKQDLESGATSNDEDPETHYNLGIAFREMGLLDEAIGELQKTCQAVDRGHPFPQVMQSYTWLAQCFLDKGMPEAAIRWYQKALNAPGIDEETRTALYYELASAHEAAGDRASALKNFMEVYGRNIDYRDVAERIKPLKS